ncbi:MAG TPA: dihydroxyacetone kinase transcriptional activator DhaS [Ruminococcaceae bacterium]|nr:dihydroxyacetone kinase transcriptional activator DhaS [Oscillospiraceae bacterium]HCC02198.1 dihydroxyacetone kinase transcriptional activator DhaS [Oscillospiraceae bacterium]HCM24218.1 dihydroxyacetone kinase transcriptional activator DhaS [Oscillospiraceae bacterium]
MPSITKMALASSLKKLMLHRPLDKITVKDIVRDCGVNRQTFYYHFRDIYDLLGWIFQTEAYDAIADCQNYDTWQQGFLKILHYVTDNSSFCTNAFRSLGRDHLELFLRNATFALLSKVMVELSKGHPIRDEDKDFITRFFSSAITGMLMDWIRSGLKASPEAMAQELSTLMEGQLSTAIERYQQK